MSRTARSAAAVAEPASQTIRTANTAAGPPPTRATAPPGWGQGSGGPASPSPGREAEADPSTKSGQRLQKVQQGDERLQPRGQRLTPGRTRSGGRSLCLEPV